MCRRIKSDRVFSIVKRVKEYLSARHGQEVECVLLYGSRARGVARESSDIDLLLVVREPLSSREVRRELRDLLLDILLEEGELVSVLVVPKTYYEAGDSPFLRQVKGEAVLV